MEEIKKLIEYAELYGHYMWPNGNNVMVKNGKNLPCQLERLIKLYKNDILYILERKKRKLGD